MELIDLHRYPVHEPSSGPGAELVALAQRQLRDDGACELPGFLTPDGLAAGLADAHALEPDAHRSEGRGTAYLEVPDPSWPADHPRARRCRYASGVVAYDQFAAYRAAIIRLDGLCEANRLAREMPSLDTEHCTDGTLELREIHKMEM